MPSAAALVSRFAAEGRSALVSELMSLAETVTEKDAALKECVRRLRTQAKTRHLLSLRGELRAAQDAGREQDVYKLLGEYQQQVKGG
jgi:hypothetical protein